MASCMKDQLNKIKWGKEMKRQVCENKSKYVISLHEGWEKINLNENNKEKENIIFFFGKDLSNSDFCYTNNHIIIVVQKNFSYFNCRVTLCNWEIIESESWQFPKERYDDALKKCQQLIDKYFV